MTAIHNMVLLCRPGGFVFLRHFENEAEKENFYGLHKWNFFERRGDMIIANRAVEISVAEKLASLASVTCSSLLERNGVVHTIIQRSAKKKWWKKNLSLCVVHIILPLIFAMPADNYELPGAKIGGQNLVGRDKMGINLHFCSFATTPSKASIPPLFYGGVSFSESVKC